MNTGRKRLQQLGCILLAAVFLLGSMPAVAFADLNPKKSASFREGSKLMDEYGNYYHYHKDYLLEVWQYRNDGTKRKIILDNENRQPKRSYMIRQGGESYRGYCLEHGIYTRENLDLKASRDDNTGQVFYKGYSKEKRNNLELGLLYGWQSGKSLMNRKDTGFTLSKYYDPSKKYNRDDWYIATQIILWEIQQDYRDDNLEYNYQTVGGEKVHKSLKYASGKYISIYHYRNIFKGSTGKDQPAYDIYRFMIDAMKSHGKIASVFRADKKSEAKTIELVQQKDGADNPLNIWMAEIKDDGKYPVKKEYMDEYRKVEIMEGKGKSSLQIEPFMKGSVPMYRITWTGKDAADAPDESVTYELGRIYGADLGSIKNNLLFWGRADYSGTVPDHHQTIVTGSKDPDAFYFKIKGGTAPAPVPGPVEDPEPEYFPEIEFPISKEDLNPGWDGNKHTGMGDASLAATYNLYKDGELIDTITLDEYGSRESFTDTPWADIDDLIKTTSVPREHFIPAADPALPPVLCCTIPYTRVEYSGQVTYEIEEIRPDGRFIEPDSGKRTYTVTYYAVSDDSRECVYTDPQWSDMEYTVNTAPMGYEDGTNTGTINDVSDTLTVKEEVFINDCYRGKITLTKSLENENVFDDEPLAGGMTKSTESYWKLYLKGGYETTRYIRFVKEADLADGTAVYRATRDMSGTSNEAAAMKIGSNGSMMIYDVPYGEYNMEEVACDDESFVREKFAVVIEEHSKGYSPDGRYDHRYDYDIRDKKISNKIQIVKTDGETGKKVTASEGAKFRIRYMGNQLLADPMSVKNSGRLLPNAPAIDLKTGYNDEFACDENGVITIPYQLKFGTYRLEEFNVPQGYYIGRYDADGEPGTADYGLIGEYGKDHDGKVPAGFDWGDPTLDDSVIVPIYDAAGNHIEYKTKADIFNYYTFKVENQELHTDGNFGQRVDCDGNITKADPSYDNEDYPYILYYRTTAMANQPVKGKIELVKSGEELSGWEKITENGRELPRPVFEGLKRLAGAVYGLFAAEDILLADGNEGPVIYDADTGEAITIEADKITHSGNPMENIKGLLDKTYMGDLYETGLLEHNSGAKLMYLNERKTSETNNKKTVYVTPEQKDTRYVNGWTALDETTGTRYRYDVYSEMKYKAGGDNGTELKVLKTTMPDNPKKIIGTEYLDEGVLLRKGESDPVLYRGLDGAGNPLAVPLGSYGGTEEDILNYTYETYIFGTEGETGPDWNGTYVDFSQGSPKRYEKTIYDYALITPAEVISPPLPFPFGYTFNGTLQAGERLIVEGVKNGEPSYMVRVVDVSDPAQTVYVECETDGTIIEEYEIEAGFTEVPYSGEGPAYVIETDGTDYRVLLEDMTWAECDEKGDFEIALVELFTINCVQSTHSDYGFGFDLDLFGMTSYAEGEGKAREALYVYNAPEKGRIECGVGYTYEETDEGIAVRGKEPYSPIYFLSRGNIRSEMYCFGGQLKAYVTIPAAAVSNLYDKCIPELHYNRADGETGTTERTRLDWFGNLNGDHIEEIFNPAAGIKITARYVTGGSSEPYYTLEVLSDKGETAPVTLSYADGYTATMYCSVAASGRDVGVLELDSIYRTKRYTKGELIELLTTDHNGLITTRELPLGKYILKEMKAPEGYVTSDKIHNFELLYKDQFTPLVWGRADGDNEVFSVEIDLKKVFETSYKSGEYRPEEGAVFGIYADEDITAPVKKDSLIAVFEVDGEGIARRSIRLPYGKYYIKEIDVKKGYIMSDIPYYFEVREEGTDFSAPLEFDYPADGITGEVYVDCYGKTVIDMRTADRYPAPYLVIDRNTYSLGAGFVHEGVTNKVNDAFYHTVIEVTDNREVTLPNGKRLEVRAKENGYEYDLEGVMGKYEPEASYTGYYGKTETEFTPEWEKVFPYDFKNIGHAEAVTAPAGYTMVNNKEGEKAIAQKGEVKKIYKVRVTDPEDPLKELWKDCDEEGNILPEFLPEREHLKIFSAFKAGGAPSVTDIEIIHTPVTFTELLEQGADLDGDGMYDKPGEKEPVEKRKGEKNPDGSQKYVHLINILAGGTGYTVKEGEKAEYKDGDNAEYEVSLNHEGEVSVIVKNYLKGAIAEEGAFRAELDGTEKESTFAKNVTLKRQSPGSSNLLVKINSEDNYGNGGIKNSRKAPLPYYPVQVVPEKPALPWVVTEAVSKTTGTRMTPPWPHTVIEDKVTYGGLEKGKEYILKGQAVNADTGDVLAENYKVFKASGNEGTVYMEFELDCTHMTGKKVVIYERIYKEEKVVCEHCDPDDELQTISFPEIRTRASDVSTGIGIGRAGKNMKITDAVTCRGLAPGTYTIRGMLADKDTGEIIAGEWNKYKGEGNKEENKGGKGKGEENKREDKGEENKGEKSKGGEVKFTLNKEGECTVFNTFSFDSSRYEGRSVVVYETLYDEEGNVLAEHMDINDALQTVRIPHISTHATYMKQGIIRDVVNYTNVIPGLEYTLIGTIADRKDGIPFGNIMEKVAFVPESSEGEIEVLFDVSPYGLEGQAVVVYEDLYVKTDKIGVTEGTDEIRDVMQMKGYVCVGSHRNKEDSLQMVVIPGDYAVPTGFKENLLLYWCILLLGAMTLIWWYRRCRLYRD